MIHAASPNRGPLEGGTEVYISGSGFISYADIDVLVGSQERVKAKFISEDLISFMTRPWNITGPVELRVTSNGIDSSDARVTFSYVSRPGLISVSPSSGPDYGGTMLTVVGFGFEKGFCSCRFGETRDVNATYVNSTVLQCSTPNAQVVTHDQGRTIKVGIAVSCDSASPQWSVYTDDYVDFTYYKSPIVQSVVPLSGPRRDRLL